jgi:hypothetical protein
LRKLGKKIVSFTLATAMTLTTFAVNTFSVSAASSDYTFVPTSSTALYAADSTVFEDDSIKVVAVQALTWVDSEKDVTVGSNSYAGWIKSSSVNADPTPAYSVDGTDMTSKIRKAFTVEAKKDTTVSIDCKVNVNSAAGSGGKLAFIATGNDTDGYEAVDWCDNRNSTSDDNPNTTLTTDLSSGDVITFIGVGTDVPVYAIDSSASTGSSEESTTVTTTETTTTTSESTTVTTETSTESTTAATEASTQATTVATETSTEATTSSAASGYTFVPSSSVPLINADATVFEDDSISVVAVQALTYVDTDKAATVGENSYMGWIKSSSVNADPTPAYSVDGVDMTSKVRKAFTVTAKKDTTISIDCKVNVNSAAGTGGKLAFIATGNDTDGYVAVDWCDHRESVSTDEPNTTLTCELAAGETVTFFGVGTDVPVYAINSSASSGSSDNSTTTTTTTTTTETSTETTTEATTEVTTAKDDNVVAVENGKAGVIPTLVDGVDGKIVAKKGDKIYVDFNMKNITEDKVFAATTFWLDYDPAVLKLTGINEGIVDSEGEIADGVNMITYNITSKVKVPFITDGSFAYTEAIPTTGSDDFASYNPDGVKTAADYGHVKASAVPIVNGGPANCNKADDAILFRATFEVQGDAGDISPVSITFESISKYDESVASMVVPITDMVGVKTTSYVKIVDEIVTTTTTESTTETTTETTTAATTTTAAQTTTTSSDVTTQATTAATVDSTTQTTTATTTTDEDTETTTHKKSSSGGGGGSSSKKAEGGTYTTKEPDTEATTRKTTTNNSTSVSKTSGTSFTAPNGTVITPPALIDNNTGKIYAGSNIPSSVLPSGTFTDTSSRAWAEKSIEKLAALGVINGVGNGKFAPDSYCKRADFIVMLVKTLGIEGTATTNFDDVVSGKYYSNAVGLAKEVGIAQGYGDGNFGPEKTITRQDMMVLVARALEFLGTDITASTSVLDRFADVNQMADYAKPYAAYLVSKGMVSGTNVGLEPTSLMTRAQLAVLVDSFYDAVVELAPEVEEVVEESTEETTEEVSEDASEESTEETTEESTEETTEEA